MSNLKMEKCTGDVCSCQKCTRGSRSTRSPKQSIQRKLQMAYEQSSPHVGLHGEPSGKFDYFVTYTHPPSTDEQIIPIGWTDDDDDHNQWHKKWDWDDSNTPSPVPFNMFHPPSLEEFSPLTSFDKNQSTHSWKVRNPTTRFPSGSVDQLSPAKKVLNWQSENAVQQNKILQKIDQTQQRIEKALHQQTQALLTPLESCRQRIEIVSNEIMDLLYKRLPFDNQEKELKNLKNQLNFLENSTLILPYSPYIPTTYAQNPPQIVGPMYFESSSSLRVLFSPEDWERTFKKSKPQKTQSKVLTKPRDPSPNPEK
ncbi:Uncharacterized protein Adt_35648 [Abeliophyllum distichum]|uniref:Uncharacterized protein n=1 Tax=Abeliophyllum distichum TaxID=126358 RepID=A0ABD1QFC3_9LAMI